MDTKKTNPESYYELSYYTLAHPDPSFIHQHIVDAYTAQTVGENTKPISITFSLVGLYLYLEKQYTGKQVQQAHMLMAKNRKPWPAFTLPADRGNINAGDVMLAEPGPERDRMIKKWCESVWNAYKDSREKVIQIAVNELDT